VSEWSALDRTGVFYNITPEMSACIREATQVTRLDARLSFVMALCFRAARDSTDDRVSDFEQIYKLKP
jgi:hypothetical protein